MPNRVISAPFSRNQDQTVIALLGNPNVGKSTLFNALTGLKQHTGNWPGKTVSSAYGTCRGRDWILVDLPGTYCLWATSQEEEVARDFVCLGNPDAVVVVADATCLERTLYLALEVMQVADRVVLCVNLMDEARKKGVTVDLESLSRELGIPVVGTSATRGDGMQDLTDQIHASLSRQGANSRLHLTYGEAVDSAVGALLPYVQDGLADRRASWLSLGLLQGDGAGATSLPSSDAAREVRALVQEVLARRHLSSEEVRDRVSSRIAGTAQEIASLTVTQAERRNGELDHRVDRIVTSRRYGFPIMLALLLGVFWITITGANVPSDLIGKLLFGAVSPLQGLLQRLFFPAWLSGLLVDGVYKTVSWVVSVMLPPMAIFFPLFTLLEDLGYLPRVAFNLDHLFSKAHAHGKQALTMCMGFGCNACGVAGCRIIDSERERLIATITNSFVPCNGKFPTLIAIITMFAGTQMGLWGSVRSALILTVLLGISLAATFFASRIMSGTILKGLPSSFQLELPPYRRPQVLRIMIRSVLDRTLIILGRAVLVAAPAGVVVWVLANTHVGDSTLLAGFAGLLDPFARLLGLDGYILAAFILGFPANEIVIPCLLLGYTAAGGLLDFETLTGLRALLVANGWTALTAICTTLFTLLHWPCGTTLLTIRAETRSAKWTSLSFLIPTLVGMAVCALVAAVARLLGFPG